MKTPEVEDVEGEEAAEGSVRKAPVNSKNLMPVYCEVLPGVALFHSYLHEKMGHVMKGWTELPAPSAGWFELTGDSSIRS
jgi:hypothetical protein